MEKYERFWDAVCAGAEGLIPIYANRHGLPLEELGVIARIEVWGLREQD